MGAAEELAEILPLASARVIDFQKSAGADPLMSNAVATNEREKAFGNKGALTPPYDLQMLAALYDHSVALRPNVEAYSTNIDAFGHRFEPIDDPDHNGQPGPFVETPPVVDESANIDPTKQSPQPEIDPKIKAAIDAEKKKLTRFFKYCCVEQSFSALRQMTRQDVESTGNGYWEVLRNASAEVTQFVYISGAAVRLLPLGDQIPIDLKIVGDDGEPTTIQRYRRFRRFIQILGSELTQKVVWFKEYGDPRVMSSVTGKYFKDVKTLAKKEPESAPATEIKHFKIHSPGSAYGVPRWMGALISVMGSRLAEEVNFSYFDNKSVPPLAILVSGGRISNDAVKRIQDYVKTDLKGRSNFHKILIIEAEPAAGVAASDQVGKMKIELRPLTSAQHNDAQFQNYDERNIDKVGMMFRMPRLLRGDARDFNRATAASALDFAEMQVFQPARQSFDYIINFEFLADMGIRYWKYVSLAPVTRDPAAMSEIIRNLVNAGVLTPGEGRELAGDVFNREFAKIIAKWTEQPLVLTLAGMAGGIPGSANGKPQGGPDGVAGSNGKDPGEANNPDTQKRFVELLFKLKKGLEQTEEHELVKFTAEHLTRMNKRAQRLATGKVSADEEREIIKIPLAKLRELIGDVAPEG